MNNLDKIKAHRKQIRIQTTQQFEELIALFNSGIILLIDSSNIFAVDDIIQDRSTAQGASETATWRFLSTLPTSVLRSFEAALEGDISIAKSILRLSLEEAIKLAYYVEFPEKALQQITEDRDRDSVGFSDILDKLEFKEGKKLKKLHGVLSNLYLHANLNIPSELLHEENGIKYLAGGPIYLPDQFEAIVNQLLVIIAIAMKYIYKRFPKIDLKWVGRLLEFLAKVDKVVN